MPDYTAIFEVLGVYARAFAQLRNLADRNLEITEGGETFRSLDRLRQEFLGVLNDSAAERDSAETVALLTDAARTVRGWAVQLKASLDSCLRGFVAAELGLRGAPLADVLRQLARAMHADSESVAANAVALGSIAADPGNAGDAQCYATIQTVDGGETEIDDERVRNQSVLIECMRDSAHHGLPQGHEEFRISPEFGAPVSARLIPVTVGDFPDARNAIMDGAFESHDGLDFAHWAVSAGGGVFSRDAGLALFGTGSLKISGDGATAGDLRQDLVARDPALPSGRWFALGAWVRVAAWTAGSVSIDLLLDGVGSALVLSIDGSTPTAQWLHKGGLLYVPRATFPNKLVARVRCSTDFDGEVNLDGLSLAPAAEIAHAGLRLGIFQGASAPNAGALADRFTLATTSDDAGAFQTFARDLLGIALPGSGTETIDDDLAQ
jgi:hypothetical protein